MIEAELVGNVDATNKMGNELGLHFSRKVTDSFAEWIFLLEFSNELSKFHQP